MTTTDGALPAATRLGRRRRPIDRVQLLLSALLAVGLAAVIYGFASANRGDPTAEPRDPVVERLIPAPGALVLRQSQVGADLALGYRGYLVIDGQEIPTFDVLPTDAAPGQAVNQSFDARFDRAQGTLLFSPTAGATVEKFAPGLHRITVVYWRDGLETRDNAKSYSWEFSVS